MKTNVLQNLTFELQNLTFEDLNQPLKIEVTDIYSSNSSDMYIGNNNYFHSSTVVLSMIVCVSLVLTADSINIPIASPSSVVYI